MNEDLNNRIDGTNDAESVGESDLHLKNENASPNEKTVNGEDGIENKLDFNRTYSAGDLGIEIPKSSELGDLKSQYSVLSANKQQKHNIHGTNTGTESGLPGNDAENSLPDKDVVHKNDTMSHNKGPLNMQGENVGPFKEHIANSENMAAGNDIQAGQTDSNRVTSGKSVQNLNVSEARSNKARNFTLKIEDDLPYPNSSSNNSFFNTMLTNQTLSDKNVDSNGVSIDKETLKDRERAFYEAENRKNHVEEKQFSAKHNKRVSPKKKLKRGSGCMPKIIISIIVVVCSIVLSYFILVCVNDLLGLFKQDDMVIVTIPDSAVVYDDRNAETAESGTGDGSSESDDGYIPTRAIAEILSENGLIDQPEFFILFSKMMNYDGDYQTGTFGLNPKEGYEGMIKALQYREKMAETVNITFPEGMTIEEIGTRLEERGVCDKDVFVEALKNSDYSSDFSFVSNIPEKEGRYYKYEGYLFPDTYNFYVDSTVDNAISRFLEGFANHWTDEYQSRAEELGMTMDDVITLASIVQKEAGVSSEMKRVASVFHNRLNSDYQRLESDPTVFYYQDSIYPYIPADDEATREFYSDHYSTYKCTGLPAGAISNPGTDAIEAVLYPEETDYLYFVTDEEGNYYYAETYSEHLANCERAGIQVR